ncbi:MAG: glycosyltransferase family 4 protein [Phormidium tanganyikae FI6-MK23]|jgi:glycosyltransferase involved in cell wall biosynthesis|nr:glycosyltransferase family 4 protein [Phormidium tanganyikae FI6-MK23]
MPSRNVIIATLMREHGETGIQTYFNAFHRYLSSKNVYSNIITPFYVSSAITFPIFGLRKLIDPFSGEFSVWWYRYWHYLLLKQALRKELNQLDKTDNVVFFAQCPLSAKAALEIRTSEKQKVFMTVHFNVSQADEWVNKGKIAFDGWLYRQIKELESEVISKLDGIVYVSEFMETTIEKNISKSRAIRSIVLPPFINQPECQEPGLIKGDLISIGALEPRKNQGYILSALAEAKKKGYRYSLTLVGEGQDRESLKKLATSLGIEDQVTLAGFQSSASKLLHHYRVYVHSALLENRSIAVIEALACSVPVIAAPTGGISECFSNNVEGLYWSLDDPTDGAEKLIQLMESPTVYASMKEAARKRFEDSFSQEAVAGKLLDFVAE